MYTKEGEVLIAQDSIQTPGGNDSYPGHPIACWANVSIDPPPAYQKFFDVP